MGRNDAPFKLALFLRGKKERTLLEVHNKLAELDAKRLILVEKTRDWFSRCPERLLGTTTISHRGEEPYTREVIYKLDHEEGSSTKDYPYKGNSAYFLAMRDSELPLYINDKSLDQYSSNIIRDRLIGELTEIPIRQDLVDEREVLDHKFDILWRLIGGYQQLLVKYMEKKVQAPKHPRFDTTELATLDIEGTIYYFRVDRGRWDVKYISRGSVVNIKGDINETL